MRGRRWGLALPTAAFTGFGTDCFDYDNDGWPDLFVANGAVNIVEAQRGQPSPFRMRNQLFRNTGATAVRGDERGGRPGVRARGDRPRRRLRRHRQRRRRRRRRDEQQRAGAAAAQSGGRSGITGCRCASTQPPGNRFGFGAWIGVERAGQPTLWRRVRTDGSYLSASDVRVHFGLGSSPRDRRRRRAVARWPA